MHRVMELFSEPKDHNEERPGSFNEISSRACRVTIIEARGIDGDLLLHALRQTVPHLKFSLVRSIGDTPAASEQVVVYSFVNRYCDLDTVERALGRLRAKFTTCPLVILTETSNAELKTLMDRFSVDCWVPATSGFDALVAAVKTAAVQDTPGQQEEASTAAEIRVVAASTIPERLALTTRERLILRLVHEGKSNKLIAHELVCSESTVKVHISNMMRKMRLNNRTQLALIYQEREATMRPANALDQRRHHLGIGHSGHSN